MEGEKAIKIRSQRAILNAERCIFFPHFSTLVLSDLHLGKAGHFRKNGLPVPADVSQKDIDRLFALVDYYSADRVIIAGDFFHANLNRELELFVRKRNQYPDLNLVLVKGNHDRWHNQRYEAIHMELYPEFFHLTSDIQIRHEAVESEPSFQISGHIHPGIQLKGPGKQFLRLPCFHYNADQLILPAFSLFTGLDIHFTLGEQRSIVISDQELIEV